MNDEDKLMAKMLVAAFAGALCAHADREARPKECAEFGWQFATELAQKMTMEETGL